MNKLNTRGWYPNVQNGKCLKFRYIFGRSFGLMTAIEMITTKLAVVSCSLTMVTVFLSMHIINLIPGVKFQSYPAI